MTETLSRHHQEMLGGALHEAGHALVADYWDCEITKIVFNPEVRDGAVYIREPSHRNALTRLISISIAYAGWLTEQRCGFKLARLHVLRSDKQAIVDELRDDPQWRPMLRFARTITQTIIESREPEIKRLARRLIEHGSMSAEQTQDWFAKPLQEAA